ncbi:MAG: CBS domain-containing protein [Deltaproteobacteria bacterium]|nr:CBS domain-containing protein [Deltaproteobacteria bacterium]
MRLKIRSFKTFLFRIYNERINRKRYIESLHFGNEPSITVRDIITPKIFSVSEYLPIRDVADSMIRNHIHRIFVTREGKVPGIISAADMLKIIRDM